MIGAKSDNMVAGDDITVNSSAIANKKNSAKLNNAHGKN